MAKNKLASNIAVSPEISLPPMAAPISKRIDFNSIGLVVLLILTFLAPLFFIPGSLSLGNFDKPLLILFGTLIIAILWIIARLKDGKITIQKSLVSLSSAILILTFLISAIASPEKDLSFFGYGYETGTFFFVLTMVVLMFLTSYLLDTKNKVNRFFSAIFVSGIVLFVLQLINLFKHLSFAGLTGSSQSLVGSWNNLAIFFGLIALILCIKISESTNKNKIYLIIGLILSIVVLAVVNFILAWSLLLGLSILYAIFRLVKERSTLKMASENRYGMAKKVSKVITWPIILIFIISLLFVVLGRDGDVGSGGGPLNKISESLVQSPFEVRPSISGTWEVAQKTMATDPLLGTGPNRFNDAWQNFKPDTVIQNPYFWNTEFIFGHGYLTTFLATTGILGTIGILALFLSILYVVVKGITKSFSGEVNASDMSLIVTSLATLYLWIILALYVPGPAIIALTFLVTGAHLALLGNIGTFKNINFSKIKPAVYGFTSVLVLVLLSILVIATGFSYTKKAMAWNNFGDGVNKIVSGDVEGGYAQLSRAVSLDERDLYYRIKSQAGLIRLTAIVNQEGKTQDELKREFENASGEAYADAISAIKLNPDYYANYISLAKVYSGLIAYGVKDAPAAAINTYDKASEIDPKNPIIPYEKATLYFALNKRKEGEEALEKSISLKSNYTDALFLRSQLAIKDGKLDKALADTYQATAINPTNTGLLFQLGFLEYRAGDYKNAIAALASAVKINPSYSNARYFLGLSLDKAGKRSEAIEQFKVVLQLNPDHQGVKDIIANLEANRDPFSGVGSNDLPDNKEAPPIDENK